MRLIGAAVLLLILILSTVGDASAQRWTGSADAAGFADGNHFYSLWFRCEGGKVSAMIGDGAGRHRAGSRQSVRISVGSYSTTLSGMVSWNDMNDEAEITPVLDAAQARPLFQALARGSRATITWPQASLQVSLAGSGEALAALERGCLGAR